MSASLRSLGVDCKILVAAIPWLIREPPTDADGEWVIERWEPWLDE